MWVAKLAITRSSCCRFRRAYGEFLRLAPHAHQAVRLPIRVGKLGDDVALDRILLTHLLDFVFQRQVLVPLGRQGKRLVVGVYAVEAVLMQAIEDAGCSGELTAVKVAGEPPGQLVLRRQLG